ncbi:Transposase_IS4 [Hexamita inflata]|uniref:Transposase IS4 n=1 Tax=Hexamita inflata TaxID=28002 RepID=A0AA86P5P2_9EUKA|nr:Transposase IS4 [Hexamita inflata]
MPTRNENIYATFKEIVTAPIEYNVKQNTEWKRKYLYYGYSTISKVEFDNYLSILFIMFVNGAKGSAQNNWSKDPIYKNQYITSIDMDYKQWQEVNRCIYFGNSDFIEEFDDRADTQGEDQYEKSDSEPEPDNEYAETEDELERKNLAYERTEYEIIEQQNKVHVMAESIKRVQTFLKMLQNQFQKIYYKYQNLFCGSNLVIDEQLIKFFGRIFFSQFNPSKPAKRGILVRTCVDCFLNFVLSMDLYAGKLTKGDRDVMSIIDRLLCFKLPYQTKLFCDNWYTTLSVVDKIIRRNIQYIGGIIKQNQESIYTQKIIV